MIQQVRTCKESTLEGIGLGKTVSLGAVLMDHSSFLLLGLKGIHFIVATQISVISNFLYFLLVFSILVGEIILFFLIL